MSSDNRRCLRVPAYGESRTAALHFGGKTLACEIANESSGGFGVAVPASYAAALAPGRIVVFQFNDLAVQVKIAHAKLESEQVVIGLERIEELNEVAATRENERTTSGNRSLVRNLCIAVALASSLLVWLFLPGVIETFQGRKKRTGTAAAPMFRWPNSLPWSKYWLPEEESTSSLSADATKSTHSFEALQAVAQPAKSRVRAVDVDQR